MFATTASINDIPLDLAKVAALVINRGTEPSLLKLLVRDEEGGGTRFDELENPVTIKISAPDKFGNPATLELEQWHITYTQAVSPGFVEMVLEDNRVTARRKRVTVGYNIQVPGDDDPNNPSFRQDTLKNGQQWTCLDAAIDAIKRFGLKYKKAKQLQRSVKFVDLPINLGNSVAGGFVSAQWDMMLPLLLDPIHCDPVINKDGSISIVDRESDAAQNLDQSVGVEGSVTDVDKHWMKPENITCEFETRVMRRFDYEEGATISRTDDIPIEMVIPEAGSGGEIFGYTEFYDEVQSETGLSRRQVLDRWLKPRVVEVDTNQDDAEALSAKDQIEGFIRSSFRQLFRIENLEGLQGMADLAIGHLSYDGSTSSTKSTYMPYAFIHKFTRVGKGKKLEEYWETVISTDVPFTYNRAAPWSAQLAMNDDGEILLLLQPEVGNSASFRELIPGHTSEPMRVGDAIDIQSDNHILSTHGQTTLKSGWFYQVMYHGLLLKDRPDLNVTRIFKETRAGITGGKVPEVTFRVSDMTANYGYENVQDMAADKLTLLNEAEITIRAEAIAEQIRRNFADGKAGIYNTAGVDAVVNGDYWVRGNIHSLTIVLGAKRPHSVEVQWVVMPEVRPVYANKQNLQGLPVRLIR